MNTSVPTRTIVLPDESGGTVTKEAVFYPEVLSRAHEEGLSSVHTSLIQFPSEANGFLAIVKAEVKTGKGEFQAHGDASPESVERTFLPHLIRVAETRAKARALRDAVNVGVVAVEELNGASAPGAPSATHDAPRPAPIPRRSNDAGRTNGEMTDGQRRYLFRLMAARGFRGDELHEKLKEIFGVQALTQVSKSEAHDMIDRLLGEAEQGR